MKLKSCLCNTHNRLKGKKILPHELGRLNHLKIRSVDSRFTIPLLEEVWKLVIPQSHSWYWHLLFQLFFSPLFQWIHFSNGSRFWWAKRISYLFKTTTAWHSNILRLFLKSCNVLCSCFSYEKAQAVKGNARSLEV